MSIKTYYNDYQIKRYIIQFMAIFEGLQIKTGKTKDGKEEFINVPIKYSSIDRSVAHIIAGNTQNKPLRLPLMSVYMSGLNVDASLYKGKMQKRELTYLPLGGSVPDDIENIEQYMPIPYRMNLDLSIYFSNQDQQFQILEQILMLFDPSLQIQVTDSAFDWTKITTVRLENISMQENLPPQMERRIIITNLEFSMPIYISPPASIKKEIIKNIYYRISSANLEDDFKDVFEDISDNFSEVVDSKKI